MGWPYGDGGINASPSPTTSGGGGGSSTSTPATPSSSGDGGDSGNGASGGAVGVPLLGTLGFALALTNFLGFAIIL